MHPPVNCYRDGWIFSGWYGHGEPPPAFMGHGPNLDLRDPAQKGTEFEGTADAAGEGSSGIMMCPGSTHRPWLGSTGPRMGYTALTKNFWGTEKGVTHSIGST